MRHSGRGNVSDNSEIRQTDKQQMNEIFRREHRAESDGGQQNVFRKIFAAFADGLPANPENICQQKKEKQKTVFFGDAVKSYRARIKRPQARRRSARLTSRKIRLTAEISKAR